jgi:hypothetical protein
MRSDAELRRDMLFAGREKNGWKGVGGWLDARTCPHTWDRVASCACVGPRARTYVPVAWRNGRGRQIMGIPSSMRRRCGVLCVMGLGGWCTMTALARAHLAGVHPKATRVRIDIEYCVEESGSYRVRWSRWMAIVCESWTNNMHVSVKLIKLFVKTSPRRR